MADVSTQLRRAREKANLEIRDISARTKIKPAFIAAIERGDFGQLPGEFFTRAFLKAYAAEVRLDPRAIAREYDECCGRAEPITIEELASVIEQTRPKKGSLGKRLAQEWAALRSSPAGTALSAFRAPSPAAIALVMALVAVAVAVTRTPAVESGETGAVGTSGTAAAPPPPAPEPASPNKLTIAIQPAAQIWVAATADGQRAVYRMLNAGDEVTVTAQHQLSFRIGNAAAFQYTINGVPGKPLGAAGEVREFQITPENYRSFAR